MKQDFAALAERRRAAARFEHSPRCGPYSECLGSSAPIVRIEDIAHMLASTCCFAKQTTFFYSIAQHDYLVSMIVPPDDALAALLADARTALEQLLPQCFETDGDAATYILARLGLPSGLPPAVEQADLVLRATERRDLGRAHDPAVAPLEGVGPLPLKIQPLPPLVAKHLFLDRYYELRPQRSPSASPVPEGAS